MKDVYLHTLVAGENCGGDEARRKCFDFWTTFTANGIAERCRTNRGSRSCEASQY